MPNETAAPARADDTETAPGDATVPTFAPTVRERVPQCPAELADLLDALLAPARPRPTREAALAVLARLYPAPAPQPERRAQLDDWKCIDDGYATGAWDAYAGNHIVVHQQRLIAFGPDLIELRARVAREHGLAPNELAVSYVEPPQLG